MASLTPHVIVLKDHLHHLTKHEGKGQKSKFSNFTVNWGKFENAIQAFRKSQFTISFMSWEKLGNIHSPRPKLQNPNVECMDELGNFIS